MDDAFATFKGRMLAFRERPDCHAILTDQGRLTRDGTLTFPRWSDT